MVGVEQGGERGGGDPPVGPARRTIPAPNLQRALKVDQAGTVCPAGVVRGSKIRRDSRATHALHASHLLRQHQNMQVGHCEPCKASRTWWLQRYKLAGLEPGRQGEKARVPGQGIPRTGREGGGGCRRSRQGGRRLAQRGVEAAACQEHSAVAEVDQDLAIGKGERVGGSALGYCQVGDGAEIVRGTHGGNKHPLG